MRPGQKRKHNAKQTCQHDKKTPIFFFQSLRGLSQLGRLELKEGSLQYLEKGVFSDTNNLIKLDLGDNNLASIHEGALLLPALEWLSLDGNRLSVLPKDIARMTKLSYLDLSYNALTSLARCDFVLLRGLEMMNLRENPWSCDCELYWLRDLHRHLLHSWVHQEMIPFVPGRCAQPEAHQGTGITAWVDMNCLRLKRSKSLNTC